MPSTLTTQNSIDELVNRYFHVAWVLKIRLISSRRQLWDRHISLIHVENAALQIRKCCEAIGYLSLILSEMEHSRIGKKYYKDYKVGHLIKDLEKMGKLVAPCPSRLSHEPGEDRPLHWLMRIQKAGREELGRVAAIHKRCDQVMHEYSPLRDLPANEKEALGALRHDVNGARGDHQWLWNTYWHHAAFIKGKLFFMELTELDRATPPRIIKDGDLAQSNPTVRFEPEYLADFSGIVNWSAINGHETKTVNSS